MSTGTGKSLPSKAYQPPTGKNDRELFVASDIQSIPMFELRPMCSNFVEWLMAIVIFKVFRAKPPIQFATETRRMMRIESEQVPKRVMKYFDQLRPKLEQLGYRLNYFATVPAIGPIAIALMTMSSESGKCHFFAVRAVIKANDQIMEDGHFGFGSQLPNDGSLTTISKTKLPKPRPGVERLMVATNDPEVLLREHRKRMKDFAVIETSATDLVEHARKQNLLECEDLLARRVIRPATQVEIQKIRAQRNS